MTLYIILGILGWLLGSLATTWLFSYSLGGVFKSRGKDITKGAIHCYRTKSEAKASWIICGHESIYEIFKVEGIGEIAHNDTEVAFKEIKFVDTVDDWEI